MVVTRSLLSVSCKHRETGQLILHLRSPFNELIVVYRVTVTVIVWCVLIIIIS